MSPSRRSPGFSGAIVEQPGGHAAVGEFPPERVCMSASSDDDAVVLQVDLDLVTWVKLDLISDRLRDHNLPLWSNPAGHTR
jgi:hypothetical protein